ncbi:MAG: hypothetical protein EOO04_33100, partial [Chitinophagaceae bacterium]
MKKLCLLPMVLCFLLISRSSSGQPLVPGDIAVLGFNSDQTTDLDLDGFNDARWAIVCLRELAVGTVVHFTDAGFTESSQFYVNSTIEGHLTWTVTTTVPAGKVFAMDCADGSNFADLNGSTSGNGGLTDNGTVSGHLGGTLGLFPPAGDQIFVYQGTSGTTAGATFIYGFNTMQNALLITSTGVWQTSGTVANQAASYLPTGLSNGTTAVALTNNVANASSGPGTFGTANYGFDNMIYGGIRTGTRAQLLNAIGNPANYTGDNATPYPIGIGGSFSIPSDFTIGGTLPLHWGKISGELKNGKALIQWETIQENNTSHFDLETSIDGQQFIVQRDGIPAAGNSANKRSYQYEFST